MSIFPGDELRAQRELRDLSVEDVYRMLRVPVSCIRALEAGDMVNIPPMTYAAGFLRSYCEFLELDPEPYVDCLQECAAPPHGHGFLRLRGWDAQARGPAWFGEVVRWGAICALLALGWVTYTVVFQPGADPAESAVRADTVDMHVPETPPVP